jgi:diguanylate cyclase (GGDEF)-like protein
MPGVPGSLIPETDEELFDLVWKDDLTGLYNRRFFARFMKLEADWNAGAPPMSMLMIDMDNLKRINDRLGHMSGDASLKRIGDIFKENVSGEQYAIRYAGDEFAILLPNVRRDEALALAERVREAVAKDSFEEANLPEGLHPSLSIGVALFPEDAPAGGDELTEAADKALYYSKRTGKNKVTSAADLAEGAEEVSDIEAMSGFPSRTLVGRAEAFKTFDEAIATVRDGHNAFVLVEGAAGTGKTRLLSELAKYSKERELAVLVERCSQVTRDDPYRVIGGLLNAYLKRRAELMPTLNERLTSSMRNALRELLPVLPTPEPTRRVARPTPAPRTGRPRGRPRPAGRPGPRGPARGPARGRPGRPTRRPTGRLRPRPVAGRPRPQPTRTPPGGVSRPPDTTTPRSTKREPAPVTIALFTGLVELLRALSGEKPLVVLLDDFEHCDEPTLEVIVRCLPQEGRVLFVGAARTEESKGTGDASEDAPYVAFRENLSEHASAHVVGLEDLLPDETVELAVHLLNGFRPPDAFSERLVSLTQGNPLFVEGVLRHLINTGYLSYSATGWKVEKEAPDELPLTLSDLLRAQLKILSPEVVEVLSTAAVVGPNFEFNVLRASAPTTRSEGETLDLVEEAVQSKLLQEVSYFSDSADFEFASRTAEDTTYDSIPEDQRQARHSAVAEALSHQDGSAATLAFHLERAGDRAKRDRFLGLVRKRRRLLFDRDAIESLGDGRKARVPEMTDVPCQELAAALPALAQGLATGAKSLRLYPSSKVATEALDGLLSALRTALDASETDSFTLSHRGNALTLNGHPVDRSLGLGPSQEAVAGIYRAAGIKSLTFKTPAQVKDLSAFLLEVGKHTVQGPLPRFHWSVFENDHDLKCLGVVQKTLVLKKQHELRENAGKPRRTSEADMPLVRSLARRFMTALDEVDRHGPDAEGSVEALANLDRAFRRLFHQIPALVLHLGEGEHALALNGTQIEARDLGPAGTALLHLLGPGRLRGLLVLQEVSPHELERFAVRIAQLKPEDFEGDKDPLQDISLDGSFPNIIVGEALFQLAQDLLTKPEPPQAPVLGDEDRPQDVLPAQQVDEQLLRKPTFRDPDLPDEFVWPADHVAERAKKLAQLDPAELARTSAGEFVEVLELLLIELKGRMARILIERLSINFASQDTQVRLRAAEVFNSVAQKGTQDLRAAYFHVAAQRLADALELETEFDIFESLGACARIGILERVAEADWDTASRLVWAFKRKRDLQADMAVRLHRTTTRILTETIEDPRFGRVFETIETGSQQERRKAGRILEGMGTVAVDRLVRALKHTNRDRVEHFLIDMLAALVPDSETAIQREVSPFSEPGPLARLLRAAAVVCRDATPVLVSALQSQDLTVQTEVVTVARSVGGKVAQNVLRWALQDGSHAAQLAAVKHLGELARADGADELLDLLGRSNIVEVQRECCLALGKMKLQGRHYDKVVPVLANVLRPGGLLRTPYHDDVRAAAAWALGQMKMIDSARKALERAQGDSDKRVALTARLTLRDRK